MEEKENVYEENIQTEQIAQAKARTLAANLRYDEAKKK